MPTHDYTPAQALEVLIRKLRENNQLLADDVQAAIDAGKVIEETVKPKGRSKKIHHYRETIALSEEEALKVALDVLEAHFVEQPLFAETVLRDFTVADIGNSNAKRSRSYINTPKQIVIEIQSVTDISKKIEVKSDGNANKEKEPELTAIKSEIPEDIEKRMKAISMLQELTNFTGK